MRAEPTLPPLETQRSAAGSSVFFQCKTELNVLTAATRSGSQSGSKSSTSETFRRSCQWVEAMPFRSRWTKDCAWSETYWSMYCVFVPATRSSPAEQAHEGDLATLVKRRHVEVAVLSNPRASAPVEQI